MHAMSRRSRQQGLSLIEVLVSILVMGLGLVGMAALQANTLKYQRGSVQRATVAALVSDFSERVSSNLSQAPSVLAGGSPFIQAQSWSDASSASTFEPGVDCDAPPSAVQSGATSHDCTAAERAAFDLVTWQGQVRQALPSGSASIAKSADGKGLLVTMMWADKDHTSGAGADLAKVQSATCDADTAGAANLSCCPASIDAPAGVRCANFVVVP
jgi:type IV pilus assembly protein PilV